MAATASSGRRGRGVAWLAGRVGVSARRRIAARPSTTHLPGSAETSRNTVVRGRTGNTLIRATVRYSGTGWNGVGGSRLLSQAEVEGSSPFARSKKAHGNPHQGSSGGFGHRIASRRTGHGITHTGVVASRLRRRVPPLRGPPLPSARVGSEAACWNPPLREGRSPEVVLVDSGRGLRSGGEVAA